MFVVDALIGNNDRSNNDWGLICHADDSLSLVPVYGNGNAFFSKRNDAVMASRLGNPKLLAGDAFGTYRSVYLVPGTEHHVDSFALIDDPGDYVSLEDARRRISTRLDMERAHRFIDAIPSEEDGRTVIGPAQRELYHTLLQMRADRICRR